MKIVNNDLLTDIDLLNLIQIRDNLNVNFVLIENNKNLINVKLGDYEAKTVIYSSSKIFIINNKALTQVHINLYYGSNDLIIVNNSASIYCNTYINAHTPVFIGCNEQLGQVSVP